MQAGRNLTNKKGIHIYNDEGCTVSEGLTNDRKGCTVLMMQS